MTHRKLERGCRIVRRQRTRNAALPLAITKAPSLACPMNISPLGSVSALVPSTSTSLSFSSFGLCLSMAGTTESFLNEPAKMIA